MIQLSRTQGGIVIIMVKSLLSMELELCRTFTVKQSGISRVLKGSRRQICHTDVSPSIWNDRLKGSPLVGIMACSSMCCDPLTLAVTCISDRIFLAPICITN